MDATLFLYGLTLAYGCTGFISLAGYVPQFAAYIKKPRVCNDAPLATWALWSFQSGIVVSYAAVVNGDIMFIVGGLLGAAGNVGGLALVLYGRAKAKGLRTRKEDKITKAVGNVVVLKMKKRKSA